MNKSAYVISVLNIRPLAIHQYMPPPFLYGLLLMDYLFFMVFLVLILFLSIQFVHGIGIPPLPAD